MILKEQRIIVQTLTFVDAYDRELSMTDGQTDRQRQKDGQCGGLEQRTTVSLTDRHRQSDREINAEKYNMSEIDYIICIFP